MKILILGAQGQLGKHLHHLFNDKYDVLAKGRQELDITDKELVINEIRRFQPDYIFNAAAYTNVEAAERERDVALRVNGTALEYIAEGAREIGAILFHFSTDYVFDGTSSYAYHESDKAFPINFYGKTKLIGEKNVQNNMDKYFIIRTSWVFSTKGNSFPQKLLQLAMKNESLDIVTDQYSAPTYAPDIANAVLDIIDHIEYGKEFMYGIYHYSGSPYTNWNLFAKEIIKLAQKKKLVNSSIKVNNILSGDLGLSAKRPLNSRLDCSKIKSIFGVEQKNWNDTLENIILDLK
ncbi:dTDP-4-dehydrorhamnose reductase [Citrobacter werkmanii]|uniref:dTDP-4-dehydrorhamnose reductase n=1 Tax=Citrobacter youngae TaxID=133448 RepID=A0A2Z4BVV1_9ENTR|nr:MULTISPECIES: dTDP-4-dehydrorhamnose reductase [Citrobacter]AWU66715.1 dTDP-6-deoxy-L-mannose-dehydrogenase [Citrobacter youngae]EJB8473509.1 dTDP-4-dehydrorhamnose reductase [Citrobacter freundii]ATF49045.1 dTDP-4-dehydrorhamnose reductase [Citrobacter werkmanii]EJB8559654.1 dTDP-4-dehydrorhamnose reductase [Citrobacter freundii]TKU64838.1 dTDP-4-dehydrorhamnose reductase [Citrobacter sp. wls711]